MTNVFKFPLRTQTDQLWRRAGKPPGDPDVIIAALDAKQRERLLRALVLEAILDGCGPCVDVIRDELDIANGY